MLVRLVNLFVVLLLSLAVLFVVLLVSLVVLRVGRLDVRGINLRKLMVFRDVYPLILSLACLW